VFRAILVTQWKWSRAAVLLASIAAFLIPLVSIAVASANDITPRAMVSAMEGVGPAYAVLAGGLGLSLAMLAWGPDHRGRHVYALSLPVERSRYSLMRLAAGGTFLLPPVGALLIGGTLVSVSGAVPFGLHAYPVLLALRFGFAAAVAYAVFFAISASTPRTAGMILGAMAAVGLAQYAVFVAGSDADILNPISEWLFGPAGFLSVFSGRWTLIDA
jgi:hypothetical protein